MRLAVALALVASLVVVQSAQAIHVAPPTPVVSCGDPQTVFVPYIANDATDHVGVNVYRQLAPSESGSYGTVAPTLVAELRNAGLQQHGHAVFLETPQARDVRYEARFVDALGQLSDNSFGAECIDTGLNWIAGGETHTEFSTSTVSGEWADASEEDPSRTDRIGGSRVKGFNAIYCDLFEGDDPGGFGERCEYEQGNADSSSQERHDKLYQFEDELWVSYAAYYSASNFEFCPVVSGDDCPDHEGGSVDQIKQKGACGTPAMTIGSWDNGGPSDGPTLRQMVADDPDCNVDTMDEIWRIPFPELTWIKVLRHIKFSDDPAVGYVETWADTDGGAILWEPVAASGQACDAGCKWNADTVASPALLGGGTVQRIFTNTMKNNVQQSYPTNLCDDEHRCSHQRAGVYRGGNVGNIVGDSTIYLDSIAAGTSLQSVLNAAF
jgi:hypothetical protein